MLYSEIEGVSIAGVSVAIPSKLLPVSSFYDKFGQEVVDKFTEMTGVQSICRSLPQQAASDFGIAAAKQLFDKFEINPQEIGALVFVSQKPDNRIPATAFHIHKALGISENCFCMDVNLACSGYIFGLQTAAALLKKSTAKKALLITADTSHKTLSPDDRTMIMLFGDSGSAVLLEKNEFAPVLKFGLETDGTRFKSIITPAGAYRNRDLETERTLWSDGIARSDYDTHMKGMDVFGFSITDVPKLITQFFERTLLSSNDYDFFLCHQANLYILKQLSRKLKFSMDKIPVSLDRFGNNSSNSVPLVLADHFCNKKGEIKTLQAGFGAGLSLACAEVTINLDKVLPLYQTDFIYNK